MNTFLFEIEKVKKFFNILERLDRTTSKYYDNKDCQRAVFVRRTVNKWLKGKYVIIYGVSEDNIEYREYLYITLIQFGYGHKDNLCVFSLNFGNPRYFNDTRYFEYNDLYHLEGEWCEDAGEHVDLLNKLTTSNLPEQTFTFEGYDMDVYNKIRKNKEERPKVKFEVVAKTYHSACELVKKQNKDKNVMIKY